MRRTAFALGAALPLLALPVTLTMAPMQAMAQETAKPLKPPKPPKPPKSGPVSQDVALAAIQAAGYTSVTDLRAYGRTWHAMAIPSASGVPVAVSVDPKGRVHVDDGTAD